MGRDAHEKRRQKKGPPFIQLFHYVIDSPAYRELPPTARAALVEIARVYNGVNNGQIAMPVRLLAGRLNASPSTAARALHQLEEVGFIETVKVGTFRRRDRLASEYRLTFHRCDASGNPPSRTFMRYGQNLYGVKNGNSRCHG